MTATTALRATSLKKTASLKQPNITVIIQPRSVIEQSLARKEDTTPDYTQPTTVFNVLATGMGKGGEVGTNKGVFGVLVWGENPSLTFPNSVKNTSTELESAAAHLAELINSDDTEKHQKGLELLARTIFLGVAKTGFIEGWSTIAPQHINAVLKYLNPKEKLQYEIDLRTVQVDLSQKDVRGKQSNNIPTTVSLFQLLTHSSMRASARTAIIKNLYPKEYSFIVEQIVNPEIKKYNSQNPTNKMTLFTTESFAEACKKTGSSISILDAFNTAQLLLIQIGVLPESTTPMELDNSGKFFLGDKLKQHTVSIPQKGLTRLPINVLDAFTKGNNARAALRAQEIGNDGKPKANDNTLNFVVYTDPETGEQKLVVFSKYDEENQINAHSAVAPALNAAGTLSVDNDGKIIGYTNESGHYKMSGDDVKAAMQKLSPTFANIEFTDINAK